MPGPAIDNFNRPVGFKQVPPVVGIFPRPAAAEHVALAVVHFAGKAVGVAALAVEIEIAVGITIDDLIIAAQRPVGIYCLVCEPKLNAAVAVMMKYTLLDDIIISFQLNPIVAGVAYFEPFKVPVISR